jgi:hypothetical protein
LLCTNSKSDIIKQNIHSPVNIILFNFSTQEVSKKIQAISSVETTYEVNGEDDIAAVISATNVMEVIECIKNRMGEGISKNNTIVVLRSS